MNDGNLPGSVRTSIAKVLFCAIAIVFALDLVLPIFLGALVRTNETTAFGRLGFLGPVLIVADSETRRSLLVATIGAISSTTVACVGGTFIGLGAAGKGRGLFGPFRFLTLFPGRMPAWVLPACMYACSGSRFSEIFVNWGLVFWIVWAGWWGATRIAAEFAQAVENVPRVEWDAARNLGRSKAATMRSILGPRLSSNYLRIAKRVALVSLFDPAPFLFLEVRHWPIGEVFWLLREAEVRSAAEAASWVLWLVLIAATIGTILRLIFGNRGRNAHAGYRSKPRSSVEKNLRSVPEFSWMQGFAYIGVWPLVLLAAGLADAINALRMPGSGVSWNTIRFGPDDLLVTSFLNGLLFAVSVAIFIKFIARICQRSWPSGIANEIVSWWSFELAICSIAIGGICSTGLSTGLIPNSEFLPGLPFWPIALVLYVLAQTRFPAIAGDEANLLASASPSGPYRAAFDSALTLGLSRRQAEALARRTERDGTRGIGLFPLVLAGWWLWISPSWAFVPLWRAASVPVGGQVLVDRLLTDRAGIRFEAILCAMLATSAVLAIPASFARFRRGE